VPNNSETPKLETRSSKLEARNSKLETRSSKLENRSSKMETLTRAWMGRFRVSIFEFRVSAFDGQIGCDLFDIAKRNPKIEHFPAPSSLRSSGQPIIFHGVAYALALAHAVQAPCRRLKAVIPT
jgi:hypothetical protein